jgi:hypothetical protein
LRAVAHHAPIHEKLKLRTGVEPSFPWDPALSSCAQSAVQGGGTCTRIPLSACPQEQGLCAIRIDRL